jgi:hypothetical protein
MQDKSNAAGVRSLLSRMFHAKGSCGSKDEAAAERFDLVHLCATFGSDPFVTSFAQARAKAEAVLAS